VAEWLRLQIKEKTWKGLVEHSLDGWNIRTPSYGYTAERVKHPVPVKASQGRTKTKLALDPVRAPVIAQVFTWRVVHKLGIPAITARLNADPARYPAPGGGTGLGGPADEGSSGTPGPTCPARSKHLQIVALALGPAMHAKRKPATNMVTGRVC